MKIAIGVDIGGTNIKAVLVSEEGNVLTRRTHPTPSAPEETQNNIKDILIKILKNIIKDKPLNTLLSKERGKSEIIGIGFGVAGLIDRKNGIVIESPNIPSINGLAVKETFEREFSQPVIVENDANTCAYGEKWIGTGKDFDNFVVITLGTGIGGGLIYNSELFKGAVEIGHMVIEPNGRFCPCGSFGCLESYAAGRAIVDRVISSLEDGTKSILTEYFDGNFYKITPELVYKAALDGDALSREVFREAGYYLGIGIANLINVFSPEAIIIGGGLVGAWDMFIEELKKEVSKRAFKALSANVKILKSILKEDCGSVGAAGLLFHSESARQSIN